MKKFLIIQTASIGDVILATPVLEKLHLDYPDSQIDILVKVGMESLFADHPFLNNVYSWNKKKDKYKNLFKLIKVIRKEKYDYVVNIQRFFSSGLITALSGGKYKSGFDKNPLSILFNHRVKHEIGTAEDYLHETERNLLLIQPFVKKGTARMKLYPCRRDFFTVDKYKQSAYICIAPTSLWYTKQYPTDKWVEFINNVPNDIRVILLGAPNDIGICNSIIGDTVHNNIINLSGKLNLLESAALMKDAQMNYVNDSAPMHLASAMNAPTTVLYCSTIPEFGFGPKSDDSKVLQTQLKLDCRPCGLHGHKECPKGHFKCAYSIDKKELISRLWKKN
ncbi:MAG: glycosyltransferase family 9 protein [Hyphomicrobiales bacterium]